MTSVFNSPVARSAHLRRLEDEPETPALIGRRLARNARGLQATEGLHEDARGAAQGAADTGADGASYGTSSGASDGPFNDASASMSGSPFRAAPDAAPTGRLLDRLPLPQIRDRAADAASAGRAVTYQRPAHSALNDLLEPAWGVRTASLTPPNLPKPPAEPTLPAPPLPLTPLASAMVQASFAPAVTNTAAAASTPYIGERPADLQWLQAREAALRATRTDHEAQRSQAQARAPTYGAIGPGWIDATLVTDESGHTHSASGAPTVFVPEPGGVPPIIGYDEGGPIYGPPPGRTLEFNDDAFAAHYRSQGGLPLQTLAHLYDTDVGTLLARHPQLWTLAMQDHAINAGPAQPGRAMGDPSQLGTLDLYMADRQLQGLISTYGGSVAPASSAIAQEQVRIHGQARYEQMTRLSQAMQAVRSDYSAAMAQAYGGGNGNGIGWTEREVVYSDESGSRPPVIQRVFDPDVFTRWYTAQGGQTHRAFADFYGQSQTQFGTDEAGVPQAGWITFSNSNWMMEGAGGYLRHAALVSLDLNHIPRLNNDAAVGFDLEAGWATHGDNIHERRDWLGTVVQIFIVGVVSWVSAGTLGPWVAGAVGATGTVAAAVVSAAVVGAAASAASGVMNGNLTFQGVLKGAFAGALTAGLTGALGSAVQGVPGGTVVLRATVQGGIQALLGGRFSDGALAGLASGLADAAGANINQGIDDALANGSMSAAEGIAARVSARVLGSAIRALGSPGDPQYAFASAFIGSVVNDGLGAPQPGGTPEVATALVFDDEGFVMPGVVDASAPWQDQLAIIRIRLQANGMDAATAAAVTTEYAEQTLDRAFDTFVTAQPLPVIVAGVGWTPDVRNARDVINDIESRIADGSLQGRLIGYAIDDSYLAYLRLSAHVTSRDTPPTVAEERAAARLISLIGDLGHVARDQGGVLTLEQQQLVLQSRALQVQSNLPEIYGAAATGGILALRQSQRRQAVEAWATKPWLRHPDQVVGRTDGGPGQWVYAPRRSGGQEFQEQVSGVPRGIEYKVRDVHFDSYDAARRVAVDSKDWQGYPPPGTDFWQRGVVREATAQVRALEGTGVRLEWQVSTPQAAEQVRAALQTRASFDPALRNVTVTVVPKASP